MTGSAGKAAVRCKALDMSDLAAAESHGKREDRSSQLRHVRDADPLTFGTLDLRPQFDAHMNGVKQNAAAKRPVLHFLIRFPPELLDEGFAVGKFTGSKLNRQQQMLDQAVVFVNKSHGGDAVFAARLDRNEAGESIVDVFASPRYEKRTKRTAADRPGDTWASATKFGRELAEKHQSEIRHRHPEAKGLLTGPRAVGIALQSEFAVFFREINGVPLTAKKQKKTAEPDRLEIEAYKEIQRARDQLGVEIEGAKRTAQRITAGAEARALEILEGSRIASKAEIDAGRAEIETARKAVEKDRAALNVDAVEQITQIEAKRSELKRAEAQIARDMRTVEKGMGLLSVCIKQIGDHFGETLQKGLSSAMSWLEAKLDDIKSRSAPEEPCPETDRNEGPGF